MNRSASARRAICTRASSGTIDVGLAGHHHRVAAGRLQLGLQRLGGAQGDVLLGGVGARRAGSLPPWPASMTITFLSAGPTPARGAETRVGFRGSARTAPRRVRGRQVDDVAIGRRAVAGRQQEASTDLGRWPSGPGAGARRPPPRRSPRRSTRPRPEPCRSPAVDGRWAGRSPRGDRPRRRPGACRWRRGPGR